MSPQSLRSLHGCCTAVALRKLVPDMQLFRQSVHLLKFFCKKRGIYKTKFGFLGGSNLAMLMTAVMRKHPHFGLTQLLLAFFDQFAQYDWSMPVTLVPTERHPEMECDQMVWEGNHSRETPVVILTPCFPASNASRNVTFSARQLIATELNRGLLVLQSALRGETEIEEIFTRVDFASSFSYFIEVTMESVSATQLAEWTGWCESKLRVLTSFIESRTPLRAIVGDVGLSGRLTATRFVGMTLASVTTEPIVLSPAMNAFVDILRYKQEKDDVVSFRVGD
ncbi:hypothetical protein WA588_002931 [Blastocystis sp. NMH]